MKLLDEAEKRTGLNRKYLREKLRPKSNLDKDSSQMVESNLKGKYETEFRSVVEEYYHLKSALEKLTL